MSTPQAQVITGLAGAGVGAATVAATYFACSYIYRKCTELPKYSREELARHKRLVELYCRILDRPEPAEWKLAPDGKRPSHEYDLTGFSDTLDINMVRVGIKSAPIRQSVSGVLTTITQLLANLDGRYFGRPRGYSVEGLFLTEIARLLLEKLPTLSFDDVASMRELRKILYFCEEMKPLITPEEKILGFISPPPRNNVIAGLREIMGNLNGVIESAEALIKAATFVRHIEALDNAVSSMAGDAFHIMNLLITGNHDHESMLPVFLFLDKEQTHRPDMRTFKQQKLAMWIEQTLDAAGIKKDNFINTKRLALAEADRHLEGECSADIACGLPTKLLNPKHKDWGHWSFSIADVDDTKVNARLINIREILRDILKLYHLRNLLTNARKVAPTTGEAWLYGDTTGLAIIATLMAAAEELTSNLDSSLSSLMDAYGIIFENIKSKPGRISRTGHDYIATYKAMRQFEGEAGVAGAERIGGFKSHYREAVTEIAAIKMHCAGYRAREAEIEESKRQLLGDLLEYLEHKGRTGEAAYRVLKLAFDELSARVVENVGGVEPEAGAARATVPAVVSEAGFAQAAARDVVPEIDATRAVVGAEADAIRAAASAEAAEAAANRIIAMLELPIPTRSEPVAAPVPTQAVPVPTRAEAGLTQTTSRARAPFRMFGSCCGGDATHVLEPGAAPVRGAIPEGPRARATSSAPRAKPSFFRMLGSCCGGDVSIVLEPGAVPAREVVPPVPGAGTRVA